MVEIALKYADIRTKSITKKCYDSIIEHNISQYIPTANETKLIDSNYAHFCQALLFIICEYLDDIGLTADKKKELIEKLICDL